MAMTIVAMIMDVIITTIPMAMAIMDVMTTVAMAITISMDEILTMMIIAMDIIPIILLTNEITHINRTTTTLKTNHVGDDLLLITTMPIIHPSKREVVVELLITRLKCNYMVMVGIANRT